MNFLHHMSNHDPFCYTIRQCAAMDFGYIVSSLKDINFSTDIIKQLKIIHDSQLIDRKWFWQRQKQPKFGDHKLSINKYGNIEIDDHIIAFDHNFLSWIIGYYNFDLYETYPLVFEKSNILFQNMYDNIKLNYQYYCDREKNKGYQIEKYNVFFLTLKTGLYFTSSDCKPYKDQPKYTFKWKGVYNEPYLLAETIINQELNTNYNHAHDKYGEDYNDRLSKISFDTAMTIVNSIKK